MNSSPSGLKVFLCHASEDKTVVRKLYDDLVSRGMSPWLDERDLLPGQDWNIAIQDAIRDSDALIVCLSSQSVTKTGYVQKEIKYALDFCDEQPEDTIYLIPVRIEVCDIPKRLSRFHSADIYKDHGFERMIESLRIRALDLGHQTTEIERYAAPEDEQPLPEKHSRSSIRLEDNFRDAFAELFWQRHPDLKLKTKRSFTVSLTGAGAVGKTAISWALTGHQYKLPKEEDPKEPFWYRLLFRESIHITDMRTHQWSQSLEYLASKSDLVFLVISPDVPIDMNGPAFMRDLEALPNTPVAVIANKIDTLESSELSSYLRDLSQKTDRIPLPTSVAEGRNLALLGKFIMKSKQMYN